PPLFSHPACPVTLSSLHFLALLSVFLNSPSLTYIYTLSLHDALPISCRVPEDRECIGSPKRCAMPGASSPRRKPHPASRSASVRDRKSTRLNSSHVSNSYAVFCLKKKNKYNPAGTIVHTSTCNYVLAI